MKVSLDIELRSNSTGPWVEVALVTEEHNVPVASMPVNPYYGADPLKTGLLLLADQLSDALTGVGQ